jgi:NAD(P)-dependent dehydrogenase (short-subunit alcohol dehydrogenase family)
MNGPDPKNLSGRTVLVTGSTQNLGFTMARILAQNGARVVLHGPDCASVETARNALRAEVPEARLETVSFDLANPSEIDRAFAELSAGNLEPDILVNNAAHLGLGTAGFLEQSSEFFREVLEVNLFGAFRCAQRAAAGMTKKGWGRIVFISSLAGERAIWGRSAYNTSKAALDGLMRSMALELAPHGVSVNAVVPGYVWTPRWNDLSPAVEERRKDNIPCAQPTRQEEIARTILFLVSDAAPSMTGARLVIDGGLGVQQVPRDVTV